MCKKKSTTTTKIDDRISFFQGSFYAPRGEAETDEEKKKQTSCDSVRHLALRRDAVNTLAVEVVIYSPAAHARVGFVIVRRRQSFERVSVITPHVVRQRDQSDLMMCV
jgi:hypothetical protein